MALTDYGDGIKLTDASATTGPFTLRGGRYGVTAKATWDAGTVTLEALTADGTNYQTVLTAFTGDGYAAVSLPAGTYRLAIATATAVYATVSPAPNRQH